MKRRAKSIDWRAVAEKMPAGLPRERLHPATLERAARESGAAPWCIACSGGADSLALVLLLWAFWPEKRSQMTLLHFNHRLRGRASAGDAVFCRQVARSLGIGFAGGAWAGNHPDASEAEARAARMDFFAREMKKRRVRLIWFAHHQDDVAETMLMRLARGSGTSGLAAPRPVQAREGNAVHLRPLLSIRKEELIATLKRAGATWREDGTNRGGAHFRNRVRSSVVPAWIRAAGRDAVAGAALSRERLEEDDSALETWLDRLAPLQRRVLDTHKLSKLPQALWRRALHRWLNAVRADTDLSRRGFEQLLAAAMAGGDTRFSLGAKGFAVLHAGRLTWQNRRLTSNSRRQLPSASL